jgi:MFS transporter, FHS family, Na+ dependent glucose transporter 1
MIAGRFYDRQPGNPVMAGSLILISIMLLLTPIIPVLWLLAIILFLLGVGEGCLDVGGNTLLMWLHREKVGPFMNGLHFMFGVGSLISPIIIAEMALLSGDIIWGYWVVALLLIPVIIWLLKLPSPKNVPLAEDHPHQKINYLLVGMIVLFFGLYVGAEASYGNWIFTYTINLNLMGPTYAAYLTSLFWGALTLGRLVSIPLAIRFRPAVILFSDIVGVLISVGLIILWPNSVPVLWIGTFGAGFSNASVFPMMLVFAQRRMRIITSWFFIGASVGGMILPWIIGQFFESVGPQVVMITIFVDMILALALFVTLVIYTNRKTDASTQIENRILHEEQI